MIVLNVMLPLLVGEGELSRGGEGGFRPSV